MVRTAAAVRVWVPGQLRAATRGDVPGEWATAVCDSADAGSFGGHSAAAEWRADGDAGAGEYGLRAFMEAGLSVCPT